MGELLEILTFRAGFNTAVVMAGTMLLGFAAGLVGVFALLRKRSLMTDALGHSTLPGIGVAFLAAPLFGLSGRSPGVLLVGATLTGVLGVASVHALLRWTRLREDAAIGVVLGVFFGMGVVVLSYIQTNHPGGAGGLNGLIFGQAATMRPHEAMMMGAIALGSVLATVLLLKEFALVCFNEPFARVDGWPVGLIDGLMMALVVVVTVAGIQAVGLVMVVAMVIIPAVSARFWTDRLWLLVLLSGLIGAMSGYVGTAVSAMVHRTPAGPVIVLAAGTVFLVSMLCAPRRGVLAGAFRRGRLRMLIAGDHMLEAAHDRGVRELRAEDVHRLAELIGWSAFARRVVVRWLMWTGYVERSRGGGLVLTERGAERGRRVSRNHALWEEYLTSYADIAPSHVDWSVDQVEHVLSERLVAELEQKLAARGHDVGASAGVAL